MNTPIAIQRPCSNRFNPIRTGRFFLTVFMYLSIWIGGIVSTLPSADGVPDPVVAPAPAVNPGFYSSPIRFDLRVGAWLPQIRSNQKANNTPDDRVNFHNLDVSPDNAFPQGEIALTILNRHRFRAEYWDSTSSGKAFLSRNITFDGTLFPTGSNVESTVELSALKLAYEFLIIDVRPVRLGLGGGAQIFSSKSQIKLTSGASKASREDDRTVWFLSGDLALNVSFLELFLNVDTLSYGDAALFDGRAGAALAFDLPPDSPIATIGAGADWRVWDTRIDDDDLDAEWTVQGLELFLFLRF